MRGFTTLLVAIFAILLAQSPAAQRPSPSPVKKAASKRWVPAVYHGLVVGKSTRAQVLKVLGKPKSIIMETEVDHPKPLWIYDASDPIVGELTVRIEHNVLKEIDLAPYYESRYTVEQILKILGPDYRVTHYRIEACEYTMEGGSTYEDPAGNYVQYEYRDRGIAINPEDMTISYVCGPMTVYSPCPEDKSKKRK